MISFLRGVLVEKQPTRVVIDAHGVGYEIFIPLSTYDKLPEKGAECILLTHDHVREDARLLYGFATEPERAMFNLLIDVSGIGPKLAVTALSGLSVREIQAAIMQADVKRLSGVSGIGRKTAERIVVELKDRITPGAALEAVAGATADISKDHRLRDAALALAALGYKQDAAAKRVMGVADAGIPDTMTVEDIIKRALGGLG